MDKETIRKLGKQGRKSVRGEARMLFQEAICKQIRESEAYKKASIILSYQAFGGEVELDALKAFAKEDGKQLAFPFCLDKTTMIALIPESEESWGEDLYGMKVPLLEKSKRVDAADIDLVLTPLVAFDEQCHRTGMGAGIYDRYLPQCTKATIIGIAFEAQKMESIPTDQHDVTLAHIISEKGIYNRK
ncbi:5-formyltetrahydrofolate cyclo-ligase [Lachnospiraceae bacterium XBB1006]|nr:5-formyltetrahydrofolate cyclo-ligase [Lachnospiraceae bacterium XBB1006]